MKKFINILIITMLTVLLISRFNTCNAEMARDKICNYIIDLKNVKSDSTIIVKFSDYEKRSAPNFYQYMFVKIKDGKLLEAKKEDCGHYSSSYPLKSIKDSIHTYDISNKIKIERDDSNLHITIDNLNDFTDHDYAMYDTIIIKENDKEILQETNEDNFINYSDNYEYYTNYYHNIKFNFINNKLEVAKTSIPLFEPVHKSTFIDVLYVILISICFVLAVATILLICLRLITKKNFIIIILTNIIKTFIFQSLVYFLTTYFPNWILNWAILLCILCLLIEILINNKFFKGNSKSRITAYSAISSIINSSILWFSILMFCSW